jgi:hypothetical protein
MAVGLSHEKFYDPPYPELFISLKIDRRKYLWSQAKSQNNRIPDSSRSQNQVIRLS